MLSEVASSLFGVVILSASRSREAGVALDFGWPLVDSSRDGPRVPFGEAVAVALAGAVAIADAVAVGEGRFQLSLAIRASGDVRIGEAGSRGAGGH